MRVRTTASTIKKVLLRLRHIRRLAGRAPDQGRARSPAGATPDVRGVGRPCRLPSPPVLRSCPVEAPHDAAGDHIDDDRHDEQHHAGRDQRVDLQSGGLIPLVGDDSRYRATGFEDRGIDQLDSTRSTERRRWSLPAPARVPAWSPRRCRRGSAEERPPCTISHRVAPRA